ncbi:ribosome recycling factor [Breznakibacter xylanolyticus]|uniref:Ribosome-recycling factor n=1 Tax=Breznakibacter xylanolyticus TaxID=990 RepID=A0A2W7NGQ3_9BACT|nr:ribosome recycling factor [Breznakibacter xylanolyticus]MBN2743127.1 ribosome recycling factor [Marinilabiliaceae bacterium]PZX15874.1 ribosome recycling factor [Breznakibacter xylanolyticus]
MNEEVQLLLEDAAERMLKSVDHLDKELAKIRAGKANPKMLDGLMVDYYGTPTPLQQVSNINTPDARTIAIQPWEKTMIGPIERAIMAANLGMNPDNNGEIIRLNVPPLTEERRKSLVKQSRQVGEDAKISVRSARRDAIEELKKMQKDGLPEDMAKDAEAEAQKLHDKYIKKVDELIEKKEKDILTV